MRPGRSLSEPLDVVSAVGRAIAGARSMNQGVARALEVLDEGLGSARSALCIGKPEERTLSVEVTHGIPADRFRPRFGRGVAGRVIESGQPIVVPAVLREPMALADLDDPAFWRTPAFSLIAVAVPLGEGRRGALSAYFPSEGDPDFQARLKVLEVVASQLGQALRGAMGGGTPPASAGQPPEQSSRAVFEYSNMIGASAVMRQVYEQVGQVARTTATVLIRGESGTGKELVAEAIHGNSPRVRMPFVRVNCAAVPETLFESELFGHERGAFTGAHARKIGRFELARGGTIFLDEVGELPLATQAKLLRVLQSREFERLGGTGSIKTDSRLVAATNKDLESAVAEGSFREDLYYRLNVFTISVPPLRDRPADVATLAEFFLDKYAAQHDRRIGRISSAALDALSAYHWPGNVRELENAIERAVVVCGGSVIEPHHLPDLLRVPSRTLPEGKLTLGEAVERLERQMIEHALRDARGNLARAARALGSTERVVRYKAGKYGIVPDRFK